MITLIEASENPWWEFYAFNVDGSPLIVYYQRAHDSYQVVDSQVPKETIMEIVKKLKQSKTSALVPT